MAGMTTAAAALVDELVAIACPVDRAVAASCLAGEFGNLPPAIAKIRREALQEARDAGEAVGRLAERARLTPRRIYQLTITRRGRQVRQGPSSEAKAHVETAAPNSTFTPEVTA